MPRSEHFDVQQAASQADMTCATSGTFGWGHVSGT